jgi:hypothetical protein
MNRTYQLAITIAFIFSATAVFGQTSAPSAIPMSGADDWSTYFPPIKECKGKTSPILNEKSGVISQFARYELVQEEPVGTPGAVVVISEREARRYAWSDCGRIVVSFDVYGTSPELLSKVELKEAKQNQKENNRGAKRSAKMYKGLVVGAPAPPPRAFKINGFDAYEILSSSDTLPGLFDDPYTTIRVKFAKGKELVIYNARVGYDQVVKTLESVDYVGLSKAMDKYVAEKQRK